MVAEQDSKGCDVNKATPRKFLEHLKNPAMAEMREGLVKMLEDTDTRIINVETSQWHPDDPYTVTITVRRWD